MKIWNSLKAAAIFTCLISVPGTALAEGNLASNATRLPDLEINSTDLTFSQTTFELETGKYYRWRIVHDGGEELAVIAPGLFRNSWINQVIINDLEITPYGLHSVEFDDEGIVDIWFVPVRPGEYQFSADGYESRGLVGKFIVK